MKAARHGAGNAVQHADGATERRHPGARIPIDGFLLPVFADLLYLL